MARPSERELETSKSYSEVSLAELERLAKRYGSDGLGTGGVDGYLTWLIRERPLAFLEVLFATLPCAQNWDEFTELCKKGGWPKELAPALRRSWQQGQKIGASKAPAKNGKHWKGGYGFAHSRYPKD